MCSTTNPAVRVLLSFAAVALAVWALYALAAVVLLLIFAALFAYLIAPLVRIAELPLHIGSRQPRLPRAAAILTTYALIAVILSSAAALLLPSAVEQVNEMVASAPAYTRSIAAWERGWSRYYERLRIPPELRKGIDESVVAAGEAAVGTSRASILVVLGAISNLPWLILIPILAFFLLKDASTIRGSIIAALPDRFEARAELLLDDLNTTLAAYIRAQLLACLIAAIACGVGFALLGVPYSLLLGVLAGILEFIPLVGPLLVAIIASIVGALHAPVLVLGTVAFLGTFRIIEDYVIYPRLIRRGIHLHPLVVILSVLAGAELNGVAGMFLAVPVVAMSLVVFRHARILRAPLS